MIDRARRFKFWRVIDTIQSFVRVSLPALMLVCLPGAVAPAAGEAAGVSYPLQAGTPCPSGRTVSIAGPSTLRFCGQINDETVDLAIRALETGYFDKLLIDSLGGFTKAGVRLGRYLNGQDIDLYVDGICMSACSQFVMLGARRVALRENSIVAMHDTQMATNLLTGPRLRSPESDADPALEAGFYEEIGVPGEVLYVPLAQLRPSCLAGAVEIDGHTGLRIKTRYSYFMPDERYFKNIYPGLLLTDWPDREMVLDRAAEINARSPEFDLRLVYGYPDRSMTVERIPDCDRS